jgi:hypothetical protein
VPLEQPAVFAAGRGQPLEGFEIGGGLPQTAIGFVSLVVERRLPTVEEVEAGDGLIG